MAYWVEALLLQSLLYNSVQARNTDIMSTLWSYCVWRQTSQLPHIATTAILHCKATVRCEGLRPWYPVRIPTARQLFYFVKLPFHIRPAAALRIGIEPASATVPHRCTLWRLASAVSSSNTVPHRTRCRQFTCESTLNLLQLPIYFANQHRTCCSCYRSTPDVPPTSHFANLQWTCCHSCRTLLWTLCTSCCCYCCCCTPIAVYWWVHTF